MKEGGATVVQTGGTERRNRAGVRVKRALLLVIVLVATSCVSSAPHQRVQKRELVGTRFSISGVLPKPVEVFVTPQASRGDACDLVLHFHGASYIPMQAIAESNGALVVAVVHLGAGGAVYERAFADARVFPNLIEAIQKNTPAIRRIYLTGFSAGYGAIRSILRSDQERVAGILLLDGLHTGYTPELSVEETKMQPFRDFALAATAGAKRFVMTHSQIIPPDYASTTETADDLIAYAGAQRKAQQRTIRGMQQLSAAECGNFRILGFSGDTAPDHMDHFHNYAVFVRMLLTDAR